MPGALVETLAVGTALLPPQGLDRTLLGLCLQPVSASPRPSDIHATVDLCHSYSASFLVLRATG